MNCITEKCENPRSKNIFASKQLCKVCYKQNEYEIASVILSLRENTFQEKVDEPVSFNLRKTPFYVALIMLIILLANSIVVSNISILFAFAISLAAYFLYYILEELSPDMRSGNLFPEKKVTTRKIMSIKDFNEKQLNLETKLEHLFKKFGGNDRHQELVKEDFEGLSIRQIKEIIKNYKT